MPIRQTLIANTVPRESFGNAYATNVLTITGSRIIGPFAEAFLSRPWDLPGTSLSNRPYTSRRYCSFCR